KERLDTFPQLIRHITKICLFHGTRLPHLLKSKNMPDILLTAAGSYADNMISKRKSGCKKRGLCMMQRPRHYIFVLGRILN
ncbi:hypothetical protein, partial [Desulfovibrio sp.]|uniref:hypothetical protein n=1 Tax=Desulfovibrio sp. TaxID=885 RepID=UPI003AB3523B